MVIPRVFGRAGVLGAGVGQGEDSGRGGGSGGHGEEEEECDDGEFFPFGWEGGVVEWGGVWEG